MTDLLVIPIVLPLLVTSLLFSKYTFYKSVFRHKRDKTDLTYFGFALLFITHEYFLLSLSMNLLGFISFEYVLGLTTFFWIEKRYGGMILSFTPIVLSCYLSLSLGKNLINIIPETILAVVVITLAALLNRENAKHLFIKFFILTTFVTIYSTMFTNYIYKFKVQTHLIFLYQIIGIVFICANLYLFNLQRYKEKTELVNLRKHESFDALTGLRNFFSFNKMITNEKTDPSRYWVFLMLDIDHFKSFNDSYGHLEGNRVLKYFSNKIKSYFDENISATYRIYRYGGEEFCIVIENFLIDESFLVINDFREELSKDDFVTEKGLAVPVSFSGGVASTQAHDGNIRKTISFADKALYEAKKDGRGEIICPECKI
ncbi:MAG: GGDEF domain-containing protein [Oenococcus oeni]|uniref:GGDEF domain-containing protein n=2 Tax=Oenococcus oeni TaxID=1247 RepID=UPI0008F8CB0F|nr:GGDEF domain-containing protein [Oenococcus oeni]OIM22763.1 GGDEF domain-containing protein [Oenococcus oeni]OLQ39152.1 GGDEF domain-containing protein [Oenococcus oeni]